MPPQCVKYFMRASLSSSDSNSVNQLLHHTFQEQKSMNLSWYSTRAAISDASTDAIPTLTPMSAVQRHYKNLFITQWHSDLQKQSKMAFYRTVKDAFGEESYLLLPSRDQRTNIARIRSSSHDLNIEIGRYSKEQHNTSLKACRFCCNQESLASLEQLPLFITPILESEEHALTECPGYHHIRSLLSDNLKSLLLLKEFKTIMVSAHLPEFGKYVTACHRTRNPRTEDRGKYADGQGNRRT